MKDHQPGLGLLVDDEYPRAEPVRRSLDTALGVKISWPVLRELLVGVGKLAGRERFASAGSHDYSGGHPTIPRARWPRCAHNVFPDERRTGPRWMVVLGRALRFHPPCRVRAPSHRGIDPAPVPDRAPQRLREDRQDASHASHPLGTLEVAGCATGSALPRRHPRIGRTSRPLPHRNSYVTRWTGERVETVTLQPLPRRARNPVSCPSLRPNFSERR